MSDTLDLASQLIELPSVTPNDEGCQRLIAERLYKYDFKINRMQFEDVDNVWLRRGTEGPVFCFAGHTDVVPPGPLSEWITDPFKAVIRDGMLYGRGAADMKSSIAAMITAAERFVLKHPGHRGSIAFLITSDEEGPAVNGTVRVIEALQQQEEYIDWCLVGEPSSSESVGDVVKNGRRGSLGGKLIIHGTQGHVAYPQLANNPIHAASTALSELVNTHWDSGNQFFPPTTFQISNINAGTGATNVIPGEMEVIFNLRYSTEATESSLRLKIESILDRHRVDHDIIWTLSGEPFLTESGKLVDATTAAIHEITEQATELSTAGGTSDGRFIAPTGAEVVELGPVNATIHKANECTNVAELDTLSEIYEHILFNLLAE